MAISKADNDSISNGAITLNTVDSYYSNGVGGFVLPGGEDTLRPTVGVANGTLRFNSTNNTIELYANNEWGLLATGAAEELTVAPPLVDVLVVAGGGGGGWTGSSSYDGGGGGAGAGGLIYSAYYPTTGGIPFEITIGAGGAGTERPAQSTGYNGSNSTFGPLIAIGGGGGGGTLASGNTGGSGGGCGRAGSTGGASIQPAPGLGNSGGGGPGSNNQGGGGGGGAGAVGVTTTPGTTGGAGGDGSEFSISGTPTYYAGGGSGGSQTVIVPGTLGGGGDGGRGNPFTDGGNGTTNSGGGGGGGGLQGNPALANETKGGDGGSGIVIISYLNAYANISTIDPGLTYTYANTGGNKIYTFTEGTGNVSWS